MNIRIGRALVAAVLLLLAPLAFSAALPTIAAKASGLTRAEGYVPLYWDAGAGRVYLEVQDGSEALMYSTLTRGLGSNDVGLDRGQVSDGRVVHFRRVGEKLLMEQPNLGFRADSDAAEEVLAVEQSFASSTLYGFTVVAAEGDQVLVDATDFMLEDPHGAIAQLAKTEQGEFKLDKTRSAILWAASGAYPENSEIEVSLTMTSAKPGKFVKDVAPTPESVTLRERVSFVALPDAGYQPREMLPGSGYFDLEYADYAAPLGAPLTRRLIVRHRLAKQDRSAPVSPAVEPIVYYIDRGAPQPIRDALMNGAKWWAQAFEAAGYQDAFRVELLPEDADPMDVRYNIIQWVHRQTRGWSYGSAVVDPRTGEIIKGNVTLGSLRARYDWLLAEGLLSPYADAEASTDAIQSLVLARLSQLAAHELGHTLGLAHNYLSSTADRASVMDYPVPLLALRDDGTVDLSRAYDTGIGAWDKVAIAYGYQDFPDGTDEDAALRGLIADARAQGLRFMTDEDARPAGAADPDVNLWDNGTDVAAELRHLLAVRQAALGRFGEHAIRVGAPMATIEEALVPLYLYHRYQVDATVKAIGGVRYTYAERGDGQQPLAPVSAAQQKDALSALLEALDPAALALPETLLAQIPPRPPGYAATRELFPRDTGLTFDALSPATTASAMVIDGLLNPERMSRVVAQHALDAGLPGFDTVLDAVIDALWSKPANGYAAQIRYVQQSQLVKGLMALAVQAPAPQLRASADWRLDRLAGELEKGRSRDDAESARRYALAAEIRRFQSREPADDAIAPRTQVPGSPLGDG